MKNLCSNIIICCSCNNWDSALKFLYSSTTGKYRCLFCNILNYCLRVCLVVTCDFELVLLTFRHIFVAADWLYHAHAGRPCDSDNGRCCIYVCITTLIDWLIDWLIGCLVAWLVDWLFVRCDEPADTVCSVGDGWRHWMFPRQQCVTRSRCWRHCDVIVARPPTTDTLSWRSLNLSVCLRVCVCACNSIFFYKFDSLNEFMQTCFMTSQLCCVNSDSVK